ncbi:MAG: cation:proton antiporter [Bdellovibrionaceae bacterium]|nr:hypothetical protein [Bdellovibrionales bacterium]MCB9255049.1 cation:proton antiporter [Pseudobdellovibrionaceae bacterium]
MTVFVGFLALALAIAGLLGLYRVVAGPDQLDRVLALDYLSIVGIGIVILLVFATGEPLLLDIGVCLALVGFLTAYLFSRFTLEERK